MRIHYILGSNLANFLNEFKQMDVDYDFCKIGLYQGFRFFSPIDLDEDTCQFILATNDENEIVGVLKFKRYKTSNHDYVSEDEFKSYTKSIKTYKGIRFVDVREDCRKQGIAREMIKCLCDMTITEGDKTHIQLGMLTPLGKKAKLKDIFKEYLPNTTIKI